MYFLSIFISPSFIYSRNRNKSGICDINITEKTSIERIRHIHNVSNLIHFYESPNISILDKLQKIEDMDFVNSPGFHILKGGLFDDFDFIFTNFFLY
jgi:hypothetical protein